MKRKKQKAGGPSVFFLVALTIAVILLVWFFIFALGHLPKQQLSDLQPITMTEETS